jgi:DNA cross-link repair 1A protein
MPTEMPRGLPFVVDTWGSSSRRRRHHHFLTHAHTDHLANAQAYPGDTVYATKLTMRLALQRFPQVTTPSCSSIYQIATVNFAPEDCFC